VSRFASRGLGRNDLSAVTGDRAAGRIVTAALPGIAGDAGCSPRWCHAAPSRRVLRCL